MNLKLLALQISYLGLVAGVSLCVPLPSSRWIFLLWAVLATLEVSSAAFVVSLHPRQTGRFVRPHARRPAAASWSSSRWAVLLLAVAAILFQVSSAVPMAFVPPLTFVPAHPGRRPLRPSSLRLGPDRAYDFTTTTPHCRTTVPLFAVKRTGDPGNKNDKKNVIKIVLERIFKNKDANKNKNNKNTNNKNTNKNRSKSMTKNTMKNKNKTSNKNKNKNKNDKNNKSMIKNDKKKNENAIKIIIANMIKNKNKNDQSKSNAKHNDENESDNKSDNNNSYRSVSTNPDKPDLPEPFHQLARFTAFLLIAKILLEVALIAAIEINPDGIFDGIQATSVHSFADALAVVKATLF